MATELKRSARGLPLLLLTPEQATAQMERRLATWPGILGGVTRARVFSFHHLAREAFLRAGGAPASQLGDVGRIMLLRQALLHRQPELSALGQSASQPGVAESIGQTLLEFQRYGWTLADLEGWIAGEAGGPVTLTLRKARDLALLWRDFEAALAAGRWDDPARMFELAAAALRRSDWLDGARLWVDGFASFTAQETIILEALLEKASQVVFALCLDPDQLALKARAGGGLRPRIAQERLFENMEETYYNLRNRLIELGLPEGQIQIERLPKSPDQPTRFQSAPALAHLESRVLGRMHPAPCPPEAWDASPEPPIELIEASDRRAEVEAVARRIVAFCRRDGRSVETRPLLLWREVAVLARDLSPYEVHLREIFSDFKIPFFFDRPRSVQGHPLTRSLLSALAVLRSGWAGDAVLHHLKCGLCGLHDEDAIGVIENAIRATDPHGAQWLVPLERDEQFRPLWRAAAEPIRQLEADLRAHTAPRALWNYLEAIQAARQLEEWIVDAQGRGDEETVQIHEQAWEQTVAWLEEFEKVQSAIPGLFLHAPDRPIRERAQELIDLAQAALASTQARLIPPTLNQVTVGAVDRSRTPEVKVTFVIGMNEGEIPKLWQPEAMLGDEERSALTRSGRQLGPDAARKRLQEHFLAYIALTRPSAKLFLTRPQVDDSGRVCNPSPYFSVMPRLFPKAPVLAIKRCGESDEPALPLRPEEWALRLSQALGHAQASLDPSAPALRQALARADALRRSPGLPPVQAHALTLAHASLRPAPPVRLNPELALAFWAEGSTLPVTALESFGECPFKFFAQRMLRLTRRQEAALNILELGTLRHDILDRLFRRLRSAEGLNWGTIDLAQADRVVDEELRRIRQLPQWRSRLDASALGGLGVEAVAAELKLFVRALRLAGRRCQFIQVESEWTFGRADELTLSAAGRTLGIKGTVDRIDALPARPGAAPVGLLIDYKSGRRKLNLARIMAGIDLQLLTYALAWRQGCARAGGAPARIGGVFYWPLSAPTRDAEPGDGEAGDGEAAAAAEPVDARWFREVKPSGLFVEDLADALDAETGPGESALAFSFRKTKDGKLYGTGQAHWPADGLAALLAHEERLLQRHAAAIAAGEIAIAPYILGKAMPCDLCDFAACCRKADGSAAAPRRIASLKREQALEQLRGEALPLD